MRYDALLIMSFGGPEGPQDVVPFLENVLKGRNVPESRKREVARRYLSYGGISPLNAQHRELRELLAEGLARAGAPLPVYLGNRNWKPFVKEALLKMKAAGVRRALAYVTSAYGSYSGCRQYLEDFARARAEIGEGAPQIDKIRGFHNHPHFIEVWTESVAERLARIPAELRADAQIAFTAHSLPEEMSAASPYVAQLNDTASLVAGALGRADWALAFQSRSGPPGEPWLEPDILKHLETLEARGAKSVIAAPIGFLSDHLEVLHDLDVRAKEKAEQLGLRFERAGTPGNHPKFVQMLVELIEERLNDSPVRRSLGERGPEPDACPPECCTYPAGGSLRKKGSGRP